MNDTFLKACRGEAVPYTPVWIMRQAGRYLPQYREVQAKADFMTICKTPELTAKVTLQPVDILGVDAAILFSDIVTTVEPMGMNLIFTQDKGPQFTNPIRSKSDVDQLIVPAPEESLSFVMEAIKILVRELENKVPLIGFAGAPFTVAAYMVDGDGTKNFFQTKKMLFTEPQLFHSLMDKVTRLTTAYLRAQIKAGAPSVMLFDSWPGILSPQDYAEFALSYVKEIIAPLRGEGVPIIYLAKGCSAVLEQVKDSGADVIGVDFRINLDVAVKQLGPNVSVQGNLDPFTLFMPKDRMEERVKEILAMASKAKGHIFNLGDGIQEETPPENVIAMVEAVHKFSRG